MTLRITIQEAGSRRAFDHVEIPVPVAPPAGPDGGHWKWVGPLPSADVDLGSGLTLVLRVIQSDSLEARERLRADRAGNDGHSKPEKNPAPAAEVRCPKCGKHLLGRNGLGPHLRRCDPKARVTAPATVSCPTCGKEFDSAMRLGPHRRMAHDYGAGHPHKRAHDDALPRVTVEKAKTPTATAADPATRELAREIFEAAHDCPEPVDVARAIKIAGIVREKFHGSFGAEGAPFVEDRELTAEQRAELSVLDGRMMAHRIVGHRSNRAHYWLFKPGIAPEQTVAEMGQAAEGT